MSLKSDFRNLGEVSLPFKGRQMYMHSFNLADPKMAQGFEDYLSAVKSLCASAGAFSGVAHMTVDEKVVVAGVSQRRPKPHVDGCFEPRAMGWSHGGGSGWLHTCNNIPLENYKRMSVIVASNVVGCRAWRGEFDGIPKSDGDLSHLSLNEGEILPANVGFLLSPDCVHESMIQEKTVARTFLRIALPVEFEF